ncbi:MAG: peptide deformylase [Patescibacteria group bacterium]
MAKLTIYKDGSPILRKKATSVNKLDKAVFKFANDMAETMEKENGIGLAAPQVGKSWRLICVKAKQGPLVFINPLIIKKSFRKNAAEEGCLSVPGIFGRVKRHNSLILSAQGLSNEIIKLKAKGLMARVIQHEIDHLDGILFTDKVEKGEKSDKDQRRI